MGKFKIIIALLGIVFLVGIANIAPQVLIWKKMSDAGKTYLAINYMTTNDELKIYTARAREIYDGHFPPNDIFSDKQGPIPFNALPSLLMAGMIYLFGGNMNLAYLGAQFLFSGLFFLAFYFIGWILWRNRYWAIFLGLFAALTPLGTFITHALTSSEGFLNLAIKNFYPLVRTPLDYSFISRMDDPLLTVPVYIAAFIAITIFWFNPKKTTAIIAGVVTGLLFYTYLHYWIFTVIILGLLFAYSIFSRKNFKEFLWLFGALAVVAVPYFINYFLFLSSPNAAEFTARVAFIEPGRYFRIAGVLGEYGLYLILAAAVLWMFYEKDRRRAVLFLAILAAGFIAWNIQLVTGFTFISSHWRQAVNPFILVIAISLLYELAKKIPPKAVAVVLIILMALLFAKKGVNAYQFLNPPADIFNRYQINENITESLRWIDKNLPGEPRIVSPSFMTNFLLSVHTPVRPYLWYSPHSLASNEDIENHFLATNKIFGIEKDILVKRLKSNFRDYNYDCKAILVSFRGASKKCDFYTLYNLEVSGGHLYLGYFQKGQFDNRTIETIWSQPFITEEKIKELKERFDKLIVTLPELEADYLYYGPWEKELSNKDFSRDKSLELVYKNPEVEIYKIRSLRFNK